jgi:hypothetical protein
MSFRVEFESEGKIPKHFSEEFPLPLESVLVRSDANKRNCASIGVAWRGCRSSYRWLRDVEAHDALRQMCIVVDKRGSHCVLRYTCSRSARQTLFRIGFGR